MIRVFNVSITPASLILLILESLLLLGAFVFATLIIGALDPADYLLHDFGIVSLLLVVHVFPGGNAFPGSLHRDSSEITGASGPAALHGGRHGLSG